MVDKYEPREFRHIPLGQLLEPENPSRSNMGDEELESLVASVRAIGVKEPLLVTPKGDDTFEVVAGHRRLKAARLAGLETVPCLIETNEEDLAAIRLHENIEREDLNTADEAMWMNDLYEQLEKDVDQVAAVVKKSRNYVEERLLLLGGHKEAFDALREGKIGFGIARELNRMKRVEDVAYYLEYAIKTGVSIRQMKQWRGEANVRAELLEKQQAAVAAGEGAGVTKPDLSDLHPSAWSTAKPYQITGSTESVECFICGHNDEMWKFLRYFACPPCAEKHIQPAAAAAERQGK